MNSSRSKGVGRIKNTERVAQDGKNCEKVRTEINLRKRGKVRVWLKPEIQVRDDI
jgi:hypothetical protein